MQPLRQISLRASIALAALANLTAPATAHSQSATAILDTAIARMGGATLARDVKRARFEMMTQWQRITFESRPYADQPQYESHSELRDYELDAWRNTRRFSDGRTTRELADVVRDSVAIRRSPGGPGGVASPFTVAPGTWVPLNVAYVDERRQLFTLAPERLLLGARDARDLRSLRDTTIGGATHARVRATVGQLDVTLLVHRGTGFLAAAAFRSAEPNDFGLVPWGMMDVTYWYGAWRKLPNGLVYPHEVDVRRVGQPYKRMTVLAATINPPATPDSFTVSDSLRLAYLATSRKPMHDVALDSARIVEGRFASFNTPGAPVGAVRLGAEWLLLETGQAPSSAERAVSWLARSDSSGRVRAALISTPSAGYGGTSWLASHGVALHAASGARPFIDATLRGHATSATGVASVERGRWLRVGGDSAWLEPIELPDMPPALIAYVPSLHWIYSAAAANPLDLDLILARARARGWDVSRVGSARAVLSVLSPEQRVTDAGRTSR